MPKSRKDYTILEIAQGKMPLTEKQVEHTGDRFMADLGFRAVRFSQARATMQTPGIPDRKYYNAMRGKTCWWEVKAEDGKQSKAQWEFQQQAEACGEVYLLGTSDVLAAWVKDGCPMQNFDQPNHYFQIAEQRDRYQPERFRYREPKK